MYGRNITNDNEKMARDLLKTCRSQMKVERPTREFEELKPEEIDNIKELSLTKDLPSGWLYDGNCYMTFEGDRLYEHPNM